jgi:hypothetical protein
MQEHVISTSDGHRVVGCGPDGELVNVFLSHLVARAFSAATVRAYPYDLLNFLRFLTERGAGMRDVVATDLFDYLDRQQRSRAGTGKVMRLAPHRGAAPATMNRRIGAARGLFEFAVTTAAPPDNPVLAAGVPAVYAPKPLVVGVPALPFALELPPWGRRGRLRHRHHRLRHRTRCAGPVVPVRSRWRRLRTGADGACHGHGRRCSNPTAQMWITGAFGGVRAGGDRSGLPVVARSYPGRVARLVAGSALSTSAIPEILSGATGRGQSSRLQQTPSLGAVSTAIGTDSPLRQVPGTRRRPVTICSEIRSDARGRCHRPPHVRWCRTVPWVVRAVPALGTLRSTPRPGSRAGPATAAGGSRVSVVSATPG